MLDSRLRDCGFGPHRHHCVVSVSKNMIPSLVLVQFRKTHPYITERLLMGHKESKQTNKKYVLDTQEHNNKCFLFSLLIFVINVIIQLNRLAI